MDQTLVVTGNLVASLSLVHTNLTIGGHVC